MTGAKAEQADAYTTPLVIKLRDSWQVVTMGGNVLDGRDPLSGKELWRMDELFGGRTATGPTFSHDMIFCTRQRIASSPLVAIKLGRVGKLDRRDIAWTYDQGTPDTCCPVAWDTLLFTVTDDGVGEDLRSLHRPSEMEAATGETAQYKASPLAAEGRIYFMNTQGLCTVVAASPKFDKLTQNQLDDETLASPCTSDGHLFIRGKKSLYCLSRGPK